MESLILLLFLVVIVLPLFFRARQQKRAFREAQELQNSLEVGDRVMTHSGMHATVVRLDEDTLELEIAPEVHTTWVRAAIREKVLPETATEDVDGVSGEARPQVAPAIEDPAHTERP